MKVVLECEHCGGSDCKIIEGTLKVECLRCGHTDDWRRFYIKNLEDNNLSNALQVTKIVTE